MSLKLQGTRPSPLSGSLDVILIFLRGLHTDNSPTIFLLIVSTKLLALPLYTIDEDDELKIVTLLNNLLVYSTVMCGVLPKIQDNGHLMSYVSLKKCIWLCQVLAAAHGIFVAWCWIFSCALQDLVP